MEAAGDDPDRGRGRRNARSLEASGLAARARRPLARAPMFDKAKLEALRAKYAAGARETEIAPAEFRKALSLVFGTNYRRAMPFAGISTLLDLPYRPDASRLPDFV